MNLEQLRTAVEYVLAVMRSMITNPDGTTRSLDDDEQATYEEGRDAVRGWQTEIERHVELERLAALGHGEPGDNPITPPNVNRDADPYDLSTLRFTATEDEVRGRALTAIERTEHLGDTERERATDMVQRLGGELIGRVLATGSMEYRRAYARMVAGQSHLLTDAERGELARAQSLVDAEGGFAVPFTLDPTILLTNDGTTSPLRSMARVTSIVTDSWNGVSSAGATASYKTEGSEADDNSIALAQPSVPVHRMDVFVPFSFEISGDWANSEADLRMVMADAKEREEARAFAVGSGVDEPTGYITALAGTASVVPTETPGVFAVGDIFTVEDELGDRFLGRAQWAAHRGTYSTIREFGDNDGHALWERLGAGQPAELIGYPARKVNESPSARNGDPGSKLILTLGDWARFLIVDRVGMNAELVPHLFGPNGRPTGQRGYFAWCRNGSDVLTIEAFRALELVVA